MISPRNLGLACEMGGTGFQPVISWGGMPMPQLAADLTGANSGAVRTYATRHIRLAAITCENEPLVMRTKANIRAVVFDIGGTLLDFSVPETRSHYHACIRSGYDYLAGCDVPLPPFPRYLGSLERRLAWAFLWTRLTGGEISAIDGIEAFHRAMGAELTPDQLHEVALRFYAPTRAIAHARPGCADAVAELDRRGYRLGIISNTIAPPVALDEHLQAEGLLEHFPVRVYSCAAGTRKPYRRIFELALAEMNIPADRTLYVGDRPNIDVKGATRAGMWSALRCTDGRSNHVRPRPDFCIRQIADLLDILPSREPS